MAFPSSFAPSCLESMFPAPMPIVKPMAWIMAMIEKTMPTAPVADVPSIETKKVSAVLYSADTIMLMIVGTASFPIRRETGVSVIFL